MAPGIVTTLAVALVCSYGVSALDNGVARLPSMGYNTWYAYQCNIDQDLIITTAKLMQSLGLQDAGYEFINLDDCWAEKNRSESGDLVPDKTRFSSGFNWLTDQVHSMGFKSGIYSDSGWFTCAGYPGSFENEARDAKTFQDWGFNFLKYDNCAIPYDDILRQNTMGKFQRMADAIADLAKSSGKPPLVFNLCEWGWSQVWLWGKNLGQSWRTVNDIGPTWPLLTNTINFNSFITMATDFNGHNDLDYLQIGNGGLTFDEAKSHFTAWALMKSPLFISTNLSALDLSLLEIMKNRELIAINQDPVVGMSISPFRWGVNPDWTNDPNNPAGYWSGPTQNGTIVMLLNTLDQPTDMYFNLTESPWIRAGRQYSVRDLWSHTDNGTAVRNFTATDVPAHGVVALLLKDAGDEPPGLEPKCEVWIQCTDQNGTRVGG
ncbi:glycoside hydrolase [Fomitiporia mediterranea MF3/22]|uniref:glycoside hydrolase n=1 Tax=Fomitiporia mediterranea (strain MF3/22) TaxID=694068 RepID=UPI0004408169|nr:glycoside hydrolase [Fomitiporia mediterranea MF3/22]EJD00169.1 glycoside hydrolase [Fomitiporia mediterranea MF3/22]